MNTAGILLIWALLLLLLGAFWNGFRTQRRLLGGHTASAWFYAAVSTVSVSGLFLFVERRYFPIPESPPELYTWLSFPVLLFFVLNPMLASLADTVISAGRHRSLPARAAQILSVLLLCLLSAYFLRRF